MSQLTAYKNKNAGTKSTFPLLLDVQWDLLSDLQTRVVAPLTRASVVMKKPLGRLTPILEVDGEDYVMMTPKLAGIAVKELGPPVAALTEQRDKIVAALDFLITGV